MNNSVSKGAKNSSIAIWIPVIVAIISGIFALWQASLSGKSAQDAIEIVASSKPLPVGTIVASFLSPKDFYKMMDGRENFNRDKNTWCFANGEENIINTPYFEWRGTGKATIENLQGYFLRGLDESGVIDPEGKDRKIGEPQMDAYSDHQHKYHRWNVASNPVNPNKLEYSEPETPENNRPFANGGISETTETINSANETRPKNIAVNYYIKIR